MTPGTTTPADTAIAEYLGDLRERLLGLSTERRRELVQEIEAHIAHARSELDDPFSEAQVRTLLERLGTPAEIARAAQYGDDAAAVVSPPTATAFEWREPAAIVLLLFGGFLALVGWLVGLVLLWASPRWRLADKLVGTFVLPGGLVTSAVVLGIAAPPVVCFGTCGSSDSGPSTIQSVLVLAVVVSPLLTALYLALRLRRAP